jgi:O-antigen/teichoic acid export membrane protein
MTATEELGEPVGEAGQAVVPAGGQGWLGRGAWAIADQGLFAGANFLLNVLMTRWLTATDYGAFTIGFTLLFLVGTIHAALLSEPMLVFGPGKYLPRIRAYLGGLICCHFLLVLPAAVCLAIAGFIFWTFGNKPLAIALIGFGINCPLVLLLWMARRASYMRLQPHKAAVAGAAYLVVLIGGLISCERRAALSLVSSLVIVGVGSLVAAGGLVASLRPDFGSVDRPLLRDMTVEHFRFGRWGVGTGILFYMSGQSAYLLLAFFHGLDASASLRALMNFVTPMTLVTFAVATVAAPTLVGQQSMGFRRNVTRLLILLIGGSILYWLAIGLLHRPLNRLAYGGRYAQDMWLIWILGATLVGTACTDMLGVALRAREQPRQVFIAFAVSAAVALTLGVFAIWDWALLGAVVALVACGLSSTIILLAYFSRLNRVPR